MQTKSHEIYGYEQQIQEITGAPAEILPILERIMRDEIFHSTLDWQTAHQFNAAARKAHKMYREAHFYYDADHALHAARWAAACADDTLSKARRSGEDAAIREAEAASAATHTAHDRAHQTLLQIC